MSCKKTSFCLVAFFFAFFCVSQTVPIRMKLDIEKFHGVRFSFVSATNCFTVGGTNYLDCTLVNATTNSIMYAPVFKAYLTNSSGASYQLVHLKNTQYPGVHGAVKLSGNENVAFSLQPINPGETVVWQEAVALGNDIKPNEYILSAEQFVNSADAKYAAMLVADSTNIDVVKMTFSSPGR